MAAVRRLLPRWAVSLRPVSGARSRVDGLFRFCSIPHAVPLSAPRSAPRPSRRE